MNLLDSLYGAFREIAGTEDPNEDDFERYLILADAYEEMGNLPYARAIRWGKQKGLYPSHDRDGWNWFNARQYPYAHTYPWCDMPGEIFDLLSPDIGVHSRGDSGDANDNWICFFTAKDAYQAFCEAFIRYDLEVETPAL
jgi:hypothetical protein